MNHFAWREGCLHAEDVDLAEVARDVGTPAYVYSTATLERHYRVFAAQFPSGALIAYSVKANGNLAVLKTLARLGAGADVVSGGELVKALRAGIPAAKIVFSGVGKTRDEMARALAVGIHQFNAESEAELEVLHEVATAMGAVAPITIRVNPDIDAHTHAKISTGLAETKFGVPWRRAREAYRLAGSLPSLKVVGVDVHIGSQITELQPFEDAFERLVELIGQLRADGHTIERADLGGGLGVSYAADAAPPDPEAYGRMIARMSAQLGVSLILEPGRLIAANAGVLLARVLYVKKGEARKFLVLDAGMNDLIRPALYDAYHEIVPVRRRDTDDLMQVYDIVGPVCETADLFARGRSLPQMECGDLVAIMTAGAYGAVMSSAYNARPPAPEVLVRRKEWSVVHPRMSYDELAGLTASRPGWKAEPLERTIALTRAALLWERAWPALWPATGVVGLYIAASLFGVFGTLPGTIRSLLVIAVLAGAGYLLYREIRQLKLPDWSDAARRVERDNRLQHRPITERDDRLLAGSGDPIAELLWRAHLVQLLRGLNSLRVAWPVSRLAAKDPYALRYFVCLTLVAGLLFAGADWQRRLAAAFTIESGMGAPVAAIDAWITPPAYTGWAPLYLRPAQALGVPVAVPAGSFLVLRVRGGQTAPHLQLDPHPSTSVMDFTGRSGSWGASAKVATDTFASVRGQGGLLGQWRIRAIPDQPPVIAFAARPTRTERDALKLSYTAGDDYGVTAARAVIRPLSHNSRAHLAIDLPLPQASAKTVSETLYSDLTAHPFAGLDVEITLEARDGAGQIGRSRPMRMRLPEHIFTNPLARALIEQRQALAVAEPHARERVAQTLDAFAIAPEKFYARQTGIYLGLRTAWWSLRKARSEGEIAQVQDLLWQMATTLEHGGLLDAAAQLRALQQLLSQALSQGAPQSTIDSLLQRYERALQRYLQALARNGAPSRGPLPPNAKVIHPEDLAAMLKAIQQLAQTGARAKAQELLSMLQNLLENMHPGGAGSGQPDKAMSGAMKALGDIIGRQRQLLDKSLREGQGAGDPKDGGGKGLAGQQGRLRQDLERILKGLGNRKLSGSEKFGEAGREMGNAQDALGQQSFDRAGDAQKNALEDLKQGAGQLAQQMMKQNGGSDEREGQDPLGRAEGANGRAGGDTKLPNASALERARQILEELRRRAAQPGRPKEERDYIDRLLRMF